MARPGPIASGFVRLRGAVLAALLGLLALERTGGAGAATMDELYALGQAVRNLYRIDPSNASGTLLYTTYPDTNSFASAQRASDGMIFYIAGSAGNDKVYRYDPATPAVAPVLLGTTGVAFLPRLAFSPAGVLYGSTIGSPNLRLYILDQTTGAAISFVTLTGETTGAGGDMAFGPDGTLYLVAQRNLYTAPLTGGAMTFLGAITGLTASLPGVAFDRDGRLLVNSNDNPGRLYWVDLASLAANLIGNLPTTVDDLASAPRVNLSGSVFEDVNYGGGAGRSLAASGGVGRPGARVELYDGPGAYLTFATTGAGGTFTLAAAASQACTVRAVNGSVTSSRPGAAPGLQPVGTFRTTASSGSAVAVTDRVGGEDPTKGDAGNGSTTLAALTTATTTPQSITAVTAGASVLGGLDFGFNFDTIVNTNDTGQGSLRQFLVNGNTLTNAGLAQAGQSPGTEVSLFMISDGAVHPGLRAGLANQLTGGVAGITLGSALPPITDPDTTLDGETQTGNVGDTNAGSMGTGGVVGVDGLALPLVSRPEVQIVDGAASLPLGIDILANNAIVRGLAVFGFGNDRATDFSEGNIRVGNAAGNALIERSIIGTSASSFTDPGAAARTQGDNITIMTSATNAIVRNNLIGYAAYMGVLSITGAQSTTVEGNEIRGNGIGHPNQDGVSQESLTANCIVRGNLIVDGEGTGIDSPGSVGGHTFVNNTISGNGIGTLVNTETAGIRVWGAGNLVDRNIVTTNFGPGVMVTVASTGNTITRNSIYANGTILNKGGLGPSGQIGIDLLNAVDSPRTGTAPFVTLNDSGDADTGANDLANFPVVTSAVVAGTNLKVAGFALPGSILEVFLADPDPSGFGEGKTYLFTAAEGGASDTDAGTGSYGPGPVNGISQGTDTTNRFLISVPLPPGVGAGSKLTATARGGSGATSEFGGLVTAAAPAIVKRAFRTDGTPLPDGASAPKGSFVKFLLYVNNVGGAVSDASLEDTLAGGFAYVAGSIRYDNSVARCAALTCTGAEEAAIFAAADAGAAGTDGVDGDVASYSPAAVRAGNQVVANAQLDLAEAKVWAMVFTVRVQ